jgi:hypothetical protein
LQVRQYFPHYTGYSSFTLANITKHYKVKFKNRTKGKKISALSTGRQGKRRTNLGVISAI